MGLRGGEDSKRSDGDGEAEGEAAESVVCVAGFTLAQTEILLEFARPVHVIGATDIDGVDEVVVEGVSVDAVTEGEFATGRPAHSMRTR